MPNPVLAPDRALLAPLPEPPGGVSALAGDNPFRG